MRIITDKKTRSIKTDEINPIFNYLWYSIISSLLMKLSKALHLFIKKYLLRIFMGFVMILQLSCSIQNHNSPTIENGILDLSDWDFNQNPEIVLKGESLFY
ncbi:hypothetical protein [Aquimarina pacifica]|uniref:hypothetical protein n=1 Tax=Aquimarina pacifica TaxID=1296415 RepID=UPI001377272F|nr:hypothetical protein [Aquimarina pacifica]